MPYRAKSHSERQRERKHTRAHDDYDRRVRSQDPALWRAKKIRSSQRWRHVRAAQLAKFPLCANPYGLHITFEPATEVDHIIPLRIEAGARKAFDFSGLQSLCSTCHDKKSGTERALHWRGVL